MCSAVFLDLTGAYDTLRHKGLNLKLLKLINCKQLSFIMELFYARTFVLGTSDGLRSRTHAVKNGVAQGSVLALTLYNIFLSDFPKTHVDRYINADDIVLTAAATNLKQIEDTRCFNMINAQNFLKQ